MNKEIKLIPVEALKLLIAHNYDMQDIMDCLPCHLFDLIDSMPTVEIVGCNACKHFCTDNWCRKIARYMNEDCFCSYAEKG